MHWRAAIAIACRHRIARRGRRRRSLSAKSSDESTLARLADADSGDAAVDAVVVAGVGGRQENSFARSCKTYHEAGLGGVEITCLYGVRRGRVARAAVSFAAVGRHGAAYGGEAKRLDMGVDLPTGSGWRMGGPSVAEADGDLTLVISGDPPAITQKWSRDNVKRPAPGGEGTEYQSVFEAVARSLSRLLRKANGGDSRARDLGHSFTTRSSTTAIGATIFWPSLSSVADIGWRTTRRRWLARAIRMKWRA